MKTPTILLLAALLLAPAAQADATAPAAATTLAEPTVDADPLHCMGPVCDAINEVCQAVNGRNCVRAAPTDARCPGLPCDIVNMVCRKLDGRDCVAVASFESAIDADARGECAPGPIHDACNSA